MAFSLGRVQLYCWFMFALLAGIFLKLVYSELPTLDNSILALLGICAGTAGLSWAIDKSSEQSAGSLSRGLMFDLVTGPNNEHQVHPGSFSLASAEPPSLQASNWPRSRDCETGAE
jgi:hypothetical protein